LLILIGTLPIKDLPLTQGHSKFDGKHLLIGDLSIPDESMMLGTASMISAATVTCKALGIASPYAVVAGDLGEGSGSRVLYRFLAEDAEKLSPNVITMHYILPMREEFEKFISSLERWSERPLLIADAGSLLIAKATNACTKFDLFTPDAGEIGFLGDPEADHPAYVPYFVFESDTVEVPRLIEQAYTHGNSPSVLLVKGPVDFIAKDGKVVATVKEPNIPAMEPIGGTGDTLTGIVSALVHSNLDPVQASIIGAKTNRVAGHLTDITPSTKVIKIIPHISEALKTVMAESS
jgi:NAD(P)H-hydrate repair Nnr-like enzyme with NAD(P)H-hydrate dehydratase domain